MPNRAGTAPKRDVNLGLMLACVLLASTRCASALNPALDISQYAHAAWKVRDGFFKGQLAAIAQTPDGYLWLGTEFGLFRFDGVQAVPWQPPDHPLQASYILSLLSARDGTLWIGTSKGLASWKDGKLATYPVRNRDDDDLELHVDGRRSRGLDYRLAAYLSAGHIELHRLRTGGGNTRPNPDITAGAHLRIYCTKVLGPRQQRSATVIDQVAPVPV